MGSLIDMGTAFAAVGAHLASSSSRVSTGTAGAYQDCYAIFERVMIHQRAVYRRTNAIFDSPTSSLHSQHWVAHTPPRAFVLTGASASDRPKMDIDGGVYPQTFTQGFPALPPTPSVDGSSAGSGWTDPPRLVKPPPL